MDDTQQDLVMMTVNSSSEQLNGNSKRRSDLGLGVGGGCTGVRAGTVTGMMPIPDLY